MKPLAGFAAGRPPNGTQAHDLSRELELSRPGSGRRYPVWGPPVSETSRLAINKSINHEHNGGKSVTDVLTHECYRCLDYALRQGEEDGKWQMANGKEVLRSLCFGKETAFFIRGNHAWMREIRAGW